MDLPRPAWVKLNSFRTVVGRFQSFMHKWGLASKSICVCGPLDQTAAHVILEYPLHRAPRRYHEMLVLNDETRCWLINIAISI